MANKSQPVLDAVRERVRQKEAMAKAVEAALATQPPPAMTSAASGGGVASAGQATPKPPPAHPVVEPVEVLHDSPTAPARHQEPGVAESRGPAVQVPPTAAGVLPSVVAAAKVAAVPPGRSSAAAARQPGGGPKSSPPALLHKAPPPAIMPPAFMPPGPAQKSKLRDLAQAAVVEFLEGDRVVNCDACVIDTANRSGLGVTS